MNYRHAFHAGNFADVLKHAVLAAVIELMQRKETAFRFIDTHAGIGIYDLDAATAEKTQEWRQGIGRILASAIPPAEGDVLAPFLRVVGEVGGGEPLRRYPGSPEIARRLLRPGDRMVVNELHPEDAKTLARRYAHDPQVRVLSLDGWQVLKAVLPPKERRGVTLVDPPFEKAGEFERLAAALVEAHRRFATGTVILWYPIKDIPAVETFARRVAGLGLDRILSVEMRVRPPASATVLSGAGLVVHNPPFGLIDKLEVIMPFLARTLALSGAGSQRISWLAGEKPKRS